MLPLPRLLRQENKSLLETAILVLSIVNWSFGRPVCSPHLCAGFLLFKGCPASSSSFLPPSLLLPHSPLTHSLTHHSSLITHHSSLITHHSSLITHHSSLITHHSSIITHHSSLITHHSSLITHSCKRHVNATKTLSPDCSVGGRAT